MLFLKKTLLLGAILGFVFPIFSANAMWTLYYQYNVASSTPETFNAIAQTLTTAGDMSGFVKNIAVAIKTNGASTIEMMLRGLTGSDYISYYSEKILDLNVFTGVNFDFASTTIPDLSSQEEWFFQLTALSGSFTLAGASSTETEISGIVHLPSTAICVQGVAHNCGDVGQLYLEINGDTTATQASTTIQQIGTLPASTCDSLSTAECLTQPARCISAYFCKITTFLFTPSENTLTQFSNLKDIIANKPPFGYFTSIKNYLNNLSASSTPAFVLTAEISNITIFGTLRTALIWILWLFFGFWVIKRIARFDF